MVNINVPYNPIPSQGPSLIPTPFRTDTGATPEAFGATVGHAIAGLGAAIGHVGDTAAERLLSYQGLLNKSEQDKLGAEFMESAGAEHLRFSSLPLEEQAKGLQDYMKNLTGIRDRIAAKASNPTVKSGFDTESLGTLGRTIFNGAGVAGHAARESEKIAADDKAAAATSLAVGTADTPTGPANQAAAEEASRAAGAAHGHSDPDEYARQNATNTITLARIQGIASKGGSVQAEQLLNEAIAGNKLTADGITQAKGIIDRQKYTTEPDQLAQSLVTVNKNPDGTMKESLEDVLYQSDRQSQLQHKGDSRYATAARDATRQRYNEAQHQAKVVDSDNGNKVMNYVTGYGGTGQLVTDPTQLTYNKGIQTLYNGLSDTERAKVNAQIEANKRPPAQMTPEMLKQYQSYKYMANTLDGQQQFLQYDFTRMGFPQAEAMALNNLQNDVRLGKVNPYAHSDMNPYLSDPLVKSALEAAGLTGAKLTAEKVMHKSELLGSLEKSITDARSEGKPMTVQEVRSELGRLLQAGPTKQVGGWFGTSFGAHEVPTQFTVPEFFKKQQIPGTSTTWHDAFVKRYGNEPGPADWGAMYHDFLRKQRQ